uniref:Uncharacterized protein n=1 Tax=Bionectria ochroleuca TaxID=29856 RepID=A0A8H7NCS0_BIOOC
MRTPRAGRPHQSQIPPTGGPHSSRHSQPTAQHSAARLLHPSKEHGPGSRTPPEEAAVAQPDQGLAVRQRTLRAGDEGAAGQDVQEVRRRRKGPRAAAKLHLPIGKIPSGATTSTAGPTPEKALLRTMREKRKRRSYMSLNDTSCSLSSRGSEGSSEPNPVTPWDPR